MPGPRPVRSPAAAGRPSAAPSGACSPEGQPGRPPRQGTSPGRLRPSRARPRPEPAMRATPGRVRRRPASRSRRPAGCPVPRAARRRRRARPRSAETIAPAGRSRAPPVHPRWGPAARASVAPGSRTTPGTRSDWWRAPSRDRRSEADSDRGARETARPAGGSPALVRSRRRFLDGPSGRTTTWESPPRSAERACATPAPPPAPGRRMPPDPPRTAGCG